MTKRTVPSQRFKHPQLGLIHIVARANATRFVARWKGRELQLTIPGGSTVAEVEKAIEAMKPKLLALRPKPEGFYPGWEYTTPETKFSMVKNDEPDVYEVVCNDGEVIMKLPDAVDGNDPWLIEKVNKTFDKYAAAFAESYLIPLAENVASRLGVSPRQWRIGYGQKRRGCCSSRGVITLSRNLVFFPIELREYVICHELAHLTHFDHSPNFYKLLDSYLGGRAAELKAKSNAHRLPFIR
ncbi:MAG: M48 family metallopeptidase [Muribaculaceae bacterium]|nr:M48 family metallopeptidase [Muribaculaceae bacterium]